MLPPGFPEEDAFELEKAKYYLNFERGLIQVDGQRIHSYDELVRLATSDKYRGKEFIEVVVILFVSGG